MIPALVYGKLSREQENLEDLLTSNVFGLLRYLTYENGLYQFLSHIDDGEILRALPTPVEGLTAEYEFWPWLSTDGGIGCEPDVLITLSINSTVLVCLLVEAKHLSEKSSYADPKSRQVTDQLAREWLCLVNRCNQRGGRPFMLYLTGHQGRPIADIDDAAKEIRDKLPGVAAAFPLQCAWLSWRHLVSAFEERVGVVQADLLALAERMDFRFFAGIHPIYPAGEDLWRFQQRFPFGGFSAPASGRGMVSSESPIDKLWGFQS